MTGLVNPNRRKEVYFQDSCCVQRGQGEFACPVAVTFFFISVFGTEIEGRHKTSGGPLS